MAVGLSKLVNLTPVAGIRVGAGAAGIRYRNRDDLVIFEIAPGARTAAVFTRNAFCAAPVTVAREHIAGGHVRYLLVNAGNANAGTGEQGLADAVASCEALARAAGVSARAVAPFSTGVIGERLAVDRLAAGIPGALAALDAGGWNRAARAIMTTDTLPKGASRQVQVGGRTVTVTGICKGAGMIRPDMATMLAFLATDAALGPAALQQCLARAVDRSFNCITVDGDTSTNDACVLVATGAAGAPVIDDLEGDDGAALAGAVAEVCMTLAQAVVRDAEGATKFITVTVGGGRGEAECLAVAYAVAQSPLVKTAFFASDPNWGRILAAVGRAGVPALDIDRVRIDLDEVCIVEAGGRAPGYSEAAGREVMARPEIGVTVSLGRGTHSATVWTCDLSFDYVKINAEYRT